MLKFSTDQIDSLERVYSSEFDKKLMSFLREEFPTEVGDLNDIQLDAICAQVIRIAQDCGIYTAIPIAQLACLAIATQGNALKAPAILDYLSDSGLPPEERVQLLLEQLSENQQDT
jgi:hypothetical protein